MNESREACPLCAAIARMSPIDAAHLAVAIPDAFPVSPGHTLILPRRHVADWFDLGSEEQAAIVALAGRVRERITSDRHPDGWNLGVNVGEAGGQTIGHVHLHLIPRYLGDRSDPRGGVRWILPDRAVYWH